MPTVGSPQRPRGYALTALVGAASATAATVGTSRPWVQATTAVAGLPRISAAVTGADLAPLAGALGPVMLAAFGAVLATRGWPRQLVGLLVVAGATVVLAAALHPGDPSPLLHSRLAARGWSPPAAYSASTQVWRWLAAVGGAGCLATGLLVVRHGAAWPSMGRRYDVPEGAPPPETSDPALTPEGDLDEEGLWRALDEGRDPTRGP